MNDLGYATALLTSFLLAGAATAGSMPRPDARGLLVDAFGHTLYSYDPDGHSGKSRCEGTCAAVWPPCLVDQGTQPRGDFSVMRRADGTRQWVYRGRPLYLFAGDARPGDHDGDGVNGVWHVLH